MEELDITTRVTRQADTENSDTFKIVLLGDQVSFGCEVESEDVTEGKTYNKFKQSAVRHCNDWLV